MAKSISNILSPDSAYCRIRRKRPSLRLIVSSATLDATAFLDYFTDPAAPDDATIVSLEGRMYPVEVAYLEAPTPDYVRMAAQVSWNINTKVRNICTLEENYSFCREFAPVARAGRYSCIFDGSRRNRPLLGRTFRNDPHVGLGFVALFDIPDILDILHRLPKTAPRLIPLALHAGLSTDEQLKVFERAERGTRKVIVSTNIAEARITFHSLRTFSNLLHRLA